MGGNAILGNTAHRELEGEFPNEIIRASAGTGKTFALSNRYLKLLASGAECHTILATTFTRKGAGEILDRIINRLSDAALDDEAARKLSAELKWNLPRERAAKILHELLRSLHRLEISTLDSFFNRVAKAFSLELRLPPTWDIVDEQEINRMQDQAIQSVLRNESVIDLLHLLSKGEASRAVAWLARETVNKVYRFYRESGDEPWDRLKKTGKYLSEEEISLLVARIEAIELDKPQIKKHWDEVTAYARAKDWAGFASTTSMQRSLEGDFKFSRTKLNPEMIDIYQRLIPHCRAYVEDRLISQNRATRDLLSEFGELLERAKDESGNLRFDDVTERLQQFVSMWDTERFAFRLDHQIQHLLLDEFQDTSLAQWNVIKPFAKNVTESDDKLRSFFCVGDMKQAIFGWRGGVAEIFDLVDDELPGLKRTTLSTSYRSSETVIELVNSVFLNVDKYSCNDPVIDEAINQWPAWFEKHATERKELKGHVTLEMAEECKDFQKRFEESKDRARNRNVIYKTIQKIKQLDKELPPHHDIGVIVRTNAEISSLIFELQKAGVPASEEGGAPLTDSVAVELVLSAIKLADHPGDSVARFHVSHSPLADVFGLDPETKENQLENGRAAQSGAAMMRARLVSEGYGPTIEALARRLVDQCTHREILRLQQLVRVAYDSPSDNERWHLRPARFVNYVREEVKVGDQRSARVRIMTVHKAKGLEFDVVVLPLKLTSKGWAGLTPPVVVGRDSPTSPIDVSTRYMGEKLRKLLPPDFQKLFANDKQRDVRESMCVLYVALTRAVHATHVILSHGAKHDHKSEAGILLATLCPDAKREPGLLYERGDKDWYRESDAKEQGDPFNLARFYLNEPDNPKATRVVSEIRSGRGMPRTSPSRLEGGEKMKLNAVFGTHDNQAALDRGTMIHGCFELVKWLDQSEPSREELIQHLEKINPTIGSYDRFVEQFQTMVQHDELRKLLSSQPYQQEFLPQFAVPPEIVLNSYYCQIQNERAFAVNLDGQLLQGFIDRLVLVRDGNKVVAADVIDFKTDPVDATNIESRVRHYKPQLDAYRKAVSQFAKIPLNRISCRLAFVESGDVVSIPLGGDVEVTNVPKPKREKNRKPATGKPNDGPSGQLTLWDDE